MVRGVIRGSIILLALMLALASAGTVLCETDCAAGEHAEAAAAMGGTESGAASHCDGERIDGARHDMAAHHGSPGGNAKHGGAHSHLRIVATVGAEVQIAPALILSDFAITPMNFGTAIFRRVDENFWKSNSSPPTKSPLVFSTGVLRI